MFEGKWTPEKDRKLTDLLTDSATREAIDAARYRVLRDLIGVSGWPKAAIMQAKTPQELDRIADEKRSELAGIIEEYAS